VIAYHVIAAFQFISELLGIIRHLRYSPHDLGAEPVQLEMPQHQEFHIALPPPPAPNSLLSGEDVQQFSF
jgi:hypothetical protein